MFEGILKILLLIFFARSILTYTVTYDDDNTAYELYSTPLSVNVTSTVDQPIISIWYNRENSISSTPEINSPLQQSLYDALIQDSSLKEVTPEKEENITLEFLQFKNSTVKEVTPEKVENTLLEFFQFNNSTDKEATPEKVENTTLEFLQLNNSAVKDVTPEKVESTTFGFLEQWMSVQITEEEPANQRDVARSAQCPYFVKTQIKFDFNKMVDVWQTVYYDSRAKVPCFRMFIRRTTNDERLENAKKLGCFGGRVQWDSCGLQITSTSNTTRLHFLQGINEDDGVLENIIISEEYDVEDGNRSQFSMQYETSDQWLAVDKLLLMRDCSTNSILVFSRVPYQPSTKELKDGLSSFGVDNMNGRMACTNISEVTIDEEYTSTDF